MPPALTRSLLPAPLLALVLALALGAATPSRGSAAATASGVVVSQIYASGGNAGASYANDFVELLNRGTAAVDLAGWSVQYATSAGTSWQATPLTGSLAAGRHLLVQLASTASVGAALPAPDVVGTTNLAAAGGKVALVSSATPLTCGATAGSCSAQAGVVDLVGYGTATDYEGRAAAPALDATTAAVRAGGGCTDTGSNPDDFAAAPPAPHASSSAATSCSGTVVPSNGSAGVAVDVDVEPTLTLSLDHATLSFGTATPGSTPTPLAEHVTVASNDVAGYTLTVQRTAFTPDDLPLGIDATAPAGGQLASVLAGSSLAAIPVAPQAALALGSTTAASASKGDVWPATIGFASPLPAVHTGKHAATVTFTVIGR